MLIPWLLIVFGVVFFLENVGLIPGVNWSAIWPLILILAGAFMLRKKNGGSCCGWHKDKKEEERH